LHGRDDGTTFFGKNKTWGFYYTPQSSAEDSWDLIKSFYPLCEPVKHIYAHDCPTNEPVGFYTGTPYGQPDFIPVEQGERVWNDYRFMAFLAYNRCTEEDAEKLYAYVKNGGKLLLTRAHLTKTTNMDAVAQGKLEFFTCALSFADGDAQFCADTVSGKPITVCTNAQAPDEVIARTGVQLEIDTWWAFNGGIDPVAYCETYKDRIRVIHLKDGIAAKPEHRNYLDWGKGVEGRSVGSGEAPILAIREWCLKNNVLMVIESEGLDPTGPEEVGRCIQYLRTLD
jgi:hypothetical protein